MSTITLNQIQVWQDLFFQSVSIITHLSKPLARNKTCVDILFVCLFLIFFLSVPIGSLSRGGDVTVYV